MAALDRFVAAQDGVYAQALDELRAGSKTSHWMWFVFPQIAGLGHSAMAVRYAIADRAEAAAYLAHPLLGRRLHECANAVLAWAGKRSADDLMGAIDAVKLRSSATLFAAADGGPVFGAIIERLFAGERDAMTLSRLG